MFNTLDSYGESGACGFLDEGESPSTTDSSYSRHITGGNNSGKEATNQQETASVFCDSQN